MKIEQRLAELGIELPKPTTPMGSYVNAVRTGNLLYMAGKGPGLPGKPLPVGKVGRDFSIEQAYGFARDTGISILATELDTKRLEILMELLPRARRLAVLADVRLLNAAQVEKFEEAARLKSVALSIVRIERPEDIEPGLQAARAGGAEGINILGSPMLFTARRKMFATTTALRLPTVYQWPDGAMEGALVAYGPRYDDTFRQWGRMAGKVLRGAKPSELPVEQPSKFELVVNMKTAKALGVTVPPSILARADEVIE